METYILPKRLVDNPAFSLQRAERLAGLAQAAIDAPIAAVIARINHLPFVFTLQCCYGHFLYGEQQDPHNMDPLPATGNISKVAYRIAYVAFCVENSRWGRKMISACRQLEDLDPANIQFCCAQWFWERQVNSYALQVEPERFKDQDKAVLNYQEALRIENIRDVFFQNLSQLVERMQTESARLP